MVASSLMGSCSSLTVRRSAGEDTDSSCNLDHGQSCRQSEEMTVCLVVWGGALEPRRKAAHHGHRCYWSIADRSVRGMRHSRICGLRRLRASVYPQPTRCSSNGGSGRFRRRRWCSRHRTLARRRGRLTDRDSRQSIQALELYALAVVHFDGDPVALAAA